MSECSDKRNLSTFVASGKIMKGQKSKHRKGLLDGAIFLGLGRGRGRVGSGDQMVAL